MYWENLMKKTVVVTGATSGIGFSVVKALLDGGYSVIGVGRSEHSTKTALDKINTTHKNADVKYVCAAFSQLEEVSSVSQQISQILTQNHAGELFALINNAGCIKRYYTTTPEGFEEQFVTNHLSGFLLTHNLLPFIIKANGSVIMTGSNSHKKTKMRWQDPMLKTKYSPLMAYKQSKLCNMLFATSLNKLFGTKIRAYVVDPGLVNTEIGNKNTGGLVGLVWSIRKKSGTSPEVCAKTYRYLCDESPSGLYHYMCKSAPYSKQVTLQNADKLYTLSQKLCGLREG